MNLCKVAERIISRAAVATPATIAGAAASASASDRSSNAAVPTMAELAKQKGSVVDAGSTDLKSCPPPQINSDEHRLLKFHVYPTW